jgi:hypothetical protein
MTDRRTLLTTLLLLAPLALVSACRHHGRHQPPAEPERRGGGY